MIKIDRGGFMDIGQGPGAAFVVHFEEENEWPPTKEYRGRNGDALCPGPEGRANEGSPTLKIINSSGIDKINAYNC